MKHTKRRKLTVEDFNRALRWSNVEVSVVGGLYRLPPSPPPPAFVPLGGRGLAPPPALADRGGGSS